MTNLDAAARHASPRRRAWSGPRSSGISAAQAAREPGLDVQLGGQAIEKLPPLSAGTVVGVLAAAIELFAAFGSLPATLLPLITALAGVAAALHALEALLPHLADVASVHVVAAVHGTTVIELTPRTSPEDPATGGLIAALRSVTIPGAERGTTLRAYVGGPSAVNADFAAAVKGKLPWFLLTIIGLSFLLLVLAFRSLLIPATAAVMNLLAAAATFGVMTAVFQWGWGLGALGLGTAGPVESTLPVLIVPILFGLSTDYQVFLISRMNEEWARGPGKHRADARRAVRAGQAGTARVITAARLAVVALACAASAST